MTNDPRQVLVVEDIYDDLRVISKILSHHQIEVLAAHSGRECLEILRTHRPHLVIMDLSLPEMDGWETLQAIRDNPDTAKIPVIAVTAYHSPDLIEDVREAGFDGYIPKPFETVSLIPRLSRFLEG